MEPERVEPSAYAGRPVPDPPRQAISPQPCKPYLIGLYALHCLIAYFYYIKFYQLLLFSKKCYEKTN